MLGRALRLGRAELEILDAKSPVVARDGARVYVWQPLDPESTVAPADDVTRIESSATTIPASEPMDTAKGSPTMRPPSEHAKTDVTTNGHTAAENESPTSLGALIQEAEALHEALSEIRARAGRMTSALRRYRRRERLVATTQASLEALKLPEVAE
jgi:hypothetical protein